MDERGQRKQEAKDNGPLRYDSKAKIPKKTDNSP